MATKANKQIMNFMDENPVIKGSGYGFDGGLVSRINDKWYECDNYFFKAPVIIEYINRLKTLIPIEKFTKEFPKEERIGWK